MAANPTQNGSGWWNDTMGGLGNKTMDWLGGTDPRTTQLSTMTPEQQRWQRQTIQSDMNAGQPSFDPIRNMVNTNAAQNTLPLLLERLTSMGARRGPTAQNVMAQMGSQLNTNLGALNSQWEQQNQADRTRRLGMAMAPSFENQIEQGQPEHLSSLIGMIMSAMTGGGSGLALGELTKILSSLQQQGQQGQQGQQSGGFSIPENRFQFGQQSGPTNYLSRPPSVGSYFGRNGLNF